MNKFAASRGLIPFPHNSKKAPVVFMLQPKGFKRIRTPEELELWEQWMIERVGLPQRACGWPGGGISGSNGGWDDSIV